MGDNELVIFKDLPDKTTPLNAYNLNHNFDVYNKKITEEAGKIDTTLEEIEDAKTNMQNDITTKTGQLEKNITDKTTALESSIKEAQTTLEEQITAQTKTLNDDITSKTNKLESDITNATSDLQKQISDSNTELAGQITKATENLESQITQSKEQLETDIGKQIASITSLSIEVVESLPTQDISNTTIYLIKPGNLPQGMAINSVKKNLQAEKLVISPLSENSVSAIAVSQEDFYLACFYVNNDWVVVGSTTTDLSGYVKKTELATLEADPTVPSHVKSITTQDISNWNNKAEKSSIPTNVSQLVNDEGYLKSYTETDPTVPSHVKSITSQNITNWNNKANTLNYNTAETKTNSSLSGKQIYSRTYTGNVPDATGSGVYSLMSINFSYSQIWIDRGNSFLFRNVESGIGLDFFYSTTDFARTWISTSGNSVRFKSGQNLQALGFKYYITLLYTK